MDMTINESFDILKDPNIECEIKKEIVRLICKEYLDRYCEFIIKMDTTSKKYGGPAIGMAVSKDTFVILMSGVLQNNISIIENSIKSIIDLINLNETFMSKNYPQ